MGKLSGSNISSANASLSDREAADETRQRGQANVQEGGEKKTEPGAKHGVSFLLVLYEGPCEALRGKAR